MSVYDNEAEANELIIRTLLTDLEEFTMEYLKLADGTFIKVSREDYVIVDREEIRRKLDEKLSDINELESMLAPSQEVPQPVDVPNEAAAPEQPTELLQPIMPDLAQPAQVPTDPNTGQPLDQSQPTPNIVIQ